ncbi:MAG: hypothetical protein R3A79_26340 [Nannocystaceae bacterium]
MKRPPGSPTRGLVLTFLLSLAAGACTQRSEASDSSCPPCECSCNDGSSGAATPGDAPVAAASGSAGADACVPQLGGTDVPLITTTTQARAPDGRDVSELVADATRKMMHDDGPGCVADLDLIAALDPKLDARLAVTRGQCEMLLGQCQAGKERLARWYETEMNMHPEQAALAAESVASMRCRAGDSSDRDRLLRAFFELQQGAFMQPFPPARCAEHLATARALIPKVKPTGVDDNQLRGGAQALFFTAAQCFAKAGDCKTAYATYRDLFPSEGLKSIADPAMREQIVREAFDSSVERCTGKAP